MTAPGLESITAAELEDHGLTASIEPGGVTFEGTGIDLARANLHLRTASRILLRLGSFHVRALGELERKASRLPWDDWLAPETPVTVRATSRKSRLFHQRAVAERVAAAAGRPVTAHSLTDDDESPGQLVVVRVFRDEATISLDSSGALLHRRGYRLASAKAPLRETLAAALLLDSGWSPATPLIDPFAGSGTIPIEAALLARGIPPGGKRSFAFEMWRGWPHSEWEELKRVAFTRQRPRASAAIIAADRDAGAVAAARANAERAGVVDDIEFRQAACSALAAPPGTGHLVTNPPYGVRIGEQRDLRDLYAALGRVARARLPGWHVTMLSASQALERQTRLPFTTSLRTRNGGIAVRSVSAIVPARDVDAPAGGP